jgi:hypothetical protein
MEGEKRGRERKKNKREHELFWLLMFLPQRRNSHVSVSKCGLSPSTRLIRVLTDLFILHLVFLFPFYFLLKNDYL